MQIYHTPYEQLPINQSIYFDIPMSSPVESTISEVEDINLLHFLASLEFKTEAERQSALCYFIATLIVYCIPLFIIFLYGIYFFSCYFRDVISLLKQRKFINASLLTIYYFSAGKFVDIVAGLIENILTDIIMPFIGNMFIFESIYLYKLHTEIIAINIAYGIFLFNSNFRKKYWEYYYYFAE